MSIDKGMIQPEMEVDNHKLNHNIMLNVTQILSDEHQNILKVIDSVLTECNQLEKGKDLDHAYFSKVIDFIKNYADGFHHAKEEDILFVKLQENVDKMHCNPIPVMFHEHETGRIYVRGMETGLVKNDKRKVIENAIGYCYLLQEHIYKEDNILFQMAEEALSEEQKSLILREYQNVETTRFPEEKLQKYLSMVWLLYILHRRVRYEFWGDFFKLI